jgi:hypothetical protein
VMRMLTSDEFSLKVNNFVRFKIKYWQFEVCFVDVFGLNWIRPDFGIQSSSLGITITLEWPEVRKNRSLSSQFRCSFALHRAHCCSSAITRSISRATFTIPFAALTPTRNLSSSDKRSVKWNNQNSYYGKHRARESESDFPPLKEPETRKNAARCDLIWINLCRDVLSADAKEMRGICRRITRRWQQTNRSSLSSTPSCRVSLSWFNTNHFVISFAFAPPRIAFIISPS